MLILMDADGPAADFSNHLLRSVGSKKTLKNVTEWNIRKLLTDEQSKRMDKLLSDSEGTFWATQPATRGAKKGIKLLVSAGHKIHWLTSPWPSCRTWEATRREWLKKNFGAHFADITTNFKKWMIHGDVLIDDKTEHVVEWQCNRAWTPGAALLFDAPYNQDAPVHIRRVAWLPTRPEVEYIPDVISELAKKRMRTIKL